MNFRDRARQSSRALKDQVFFFVIALLLFWGLEALDQYVFQPSGSWKSLDLYGIRPRTASGLWGILCSPFLHHGFDHLAANSVPFVFLGWLVMLTTGASRFLSVSAVIILVGGLGTWLIGEPNTSHVGASGLIFGYLGFLMIRAYYQRSLGSILLALAVAALYGGLVFGVLPGRSGISWEAHLCGFVGGGVAARMVAPPPRKTTAPQTT